MLDGVELVVKGPSVPGESLLPTSARARAIPVWSEIELGYRLLPGNPIVGVTGTKGKTTTTRLLGAIFDAADRPVVLAGTEHVPLTEVVDTIERGTWVVCELSSFALEDVHAFACHVAVLLNVEPDHLEPEPKCGAGGLRRVALPPAVSGETPADLDAGRERRLERLDREPGEPEEHAIVGPLEHPEPEAVRLEPRLDPIDQRVALRRGQGTLEEAHDLGVRVEFRERSQVRRPPATQDQPRRREGGSTRVAHHVRLPEAAVGPRAGTPGWHRRRRGPLVRSGGKGRWSDGSS